MTERKPYRVFRTKVAGVTYDNPDGSSRQKIIKRCRVGEEAQLVWEPNNPHDANAVAVRRQSDEQIGYLNRDVAETFVGQSQGGKQFSAEVAELIGGGWLSGKSRGVVLEIAMYHPEPEARQE